MSAPKVQARVEKVLALMAERFDQPYPLDFSCDPDIERFMSDYCKNSPSSLFDPDEISLETYALARPVREEQVKKEIRSMLSDEVLRAETEAAINSQMRAAGFSEVEMASLPQSPGKKYLSLILRLQENQAATEAAGTSHESGAAFFEVSVVKGVALNGTPESRKITMAASTTWPEFERALSDTTATWKSEEQGYPYGYGLRDGKWRYIMQQKSGTNVTLELFDDLKDARDYKALRRLRAANPGLIIEIWHVSSSTLHDSVLFVRQISISGD